MNYLNQMVLRNFYNANHQLFIVGAVSFFGFPLGYWIWAVWFSQPHGMLALRLVGSLLGLGLMLMSYWPVTSKLYLAWYWFFTLLYTLSFFSAYAFLMNKATLVSAMSLLASACFLILLVDLLCLSLFLFIGWSLAFACYYLMSPAMYFGEAHIQMTCMLFFVIVTGSTVNYKTIGLLQQRLKGLAASAGMIVHELRTPLLGIKSGVHAFAHYLPQLFHTYRFAKEQGLLETSIGERKLKQLEEVTDRIMKEVDDAHIIIDMFLIRASGENRLQNIVLSACSMKECLTEALERYPFKSKRERALINWQGDFIFIGSKLLMQHVFFNLLKNALYAIASARKGKICIWVECGNKINTLYFKDTAKGLSKKQIAQIFSHFYTTTSMGTGVGLSFCKLVMNHFGGEIDCDAQEGQYTQFGLTFPSINSV